MTEPKCNWEYYVQVAWFVRLWEPCRSAGVTLTFEDTLMDLAVRDGERLLWCIEVNEQVAQLGRLLTALSGHGSRGIDLEQPDRGNDHLRKAKYLVRHRPEFFSTVAIGVERHFAVEYPAPACFTLRDAAPPLHVLDRPA